MKKIKVMIEAEIDLLYFEWSVGCYININNGELETVVAPNTFDPNKKIVFRNGEYDVGSRYDMRDQNSYRVGSLKLHTTPDGLPHGLFYACIYGGPKIPADKYVRFSDKKIFDIKWMD